MHRWNSITRRGCNRIPARAVLYTIGRMGEAFDTERNTDTARSHTTTASADVQFSAHPPASRPGLWVWLRDLMISLAISAFIIVFIYQPVKVEGTSMMPSLADQERIFVNKFVYRLEPISRGDIVVFRYPRDPSKSYIKRVIGAEGDHIRIDGGQVYVNGIALDEDY